LVFVPTFGRLKLPIWYPNPGSPDHPETRDGKVMTPPKVAQGQVVPLDGPYARQWADWWETLIRRIDIRLQLGAASPPSQVEWSRAETVAVWAKAFSLTRKAMAAALDANTITHRKISRQSYQVDISQLPSKERDKHRAK
jgi:hypothetical protein